MDNSARAVANACGQNPYPPIVPCHRVVRSDGSLGGYSGVGGNRIHQDPKQCHKQNICRLLSEDFTSYTVTILCVHNPHTNRLSLMLAYMEQQNVFTDIQWACSGLLLFDWF